MPKNRTIPFGYKMVNGVMQKHTEEAAAVAWIFRRYLEGMSLKAIAAEMTVPYSACTLWNKNMVKRIIENEKYLGTDKFPQLIDADTFRQANTLRVRKATSLCVLTEDLKEIRRRAYCAECGNRLFRYNDTGLWDCRGKSCFPLQFAMTDEMLTSALLHMLNTVIANPALLQTKRKICVYKPTSAVTRKENEIRQMTDQPQPDYGRIRSELLNLAALKFDCCVLDDRQQKTQQLKALLIGQEQMSELNIELFKACVRKIRVSHFYAIDMEMTNGIIIQNTTERTDTFNGHSPECADHSREETVD